MSLDKGQAVSVNEKLGPSFLWGDHPVASGDGSTVAYRANRGGRSTGRVPQPQGGKWWVVIHRHGKATEVGPFDGVGPEIRISADNRVLFSASVGTSSYFVVNDKRKKIVGRVQRIRVGPRPHDVALQRYQNGKVFVDHMGKTYGPYAGATSYAPPRFADNGALVHGVGSTGAQSIVFHNKTGPAFEKVWQYAHHLNSRGDRIAYRASRNRRNLVVIQGRDGKATEILDGLDAWFSPDGRHVVYQKRSRSKGSRRSYAKEIVIGDRVYGPHIWTTRRPRFSADNKKVAFGVRIGDELWWKVFDLVATERWAACRPGALQ